MRNIIEVIDKMIEHIPVDQREFVVPDLEKIKVSVRYKAPEAIFECWNRCAAILKYHFGKPDTDWKKEIAAIFSGQLKK